MKKTIRLVIDNTASPSATGRAVAKRKRRRDTPEEAFAKMIAEGEAADRRAILAESRRRAREEDEPRPPRRRLEEREADDEVAEVRDDAKHCLAHPRCFNQTELHFLRNMAFARFASPRQRGWLAQLVDFLAMQIE